MVRKSLLEAVHSCCTGWLLGGLSFSTKKVLDTRKHNIENVPHGTRRTVETEAALPKRCQ